MLIGDPLGEGSNASSTNNELWPTDHSDRSQSSGERINSDTQNERELRRSEGSSMLINDPLGEGSNASSYRQRALESGGLLPQSNASSTNNELWRVENSFLRMRRNLDAQKGAACS